MDSAPEGAIELVSAPEIEAAARRIALSVRRTPLLTTSLTPEPSLFVKAESLQLTGSFKLRGATNAVALLSADERRRGVVTHSSGNHGQALARAAQAAGVRATVVMPHGSPSVKQQATLRYGAQVVLVDAADRASAVERIRNQTGAVFVSPFDDRAVIAGQGTVGLEIAEDLPEVATVVVPVSGGGLISGVAAAVKSRYPGAAVIGVEPELAGDLAEGFRRGVRSVWSSDLTRRTIADGLRVPAVGELNWLHIRRLVDDVVTVSESAILAAMRRILMEERLVCEPSGAVAVAGCLEHPGLLERGATVAVVSGGNVEPSLLAEVVAGAVTDEPTLATSIPSGSR
jgi:threonine dehydratase